LSVTGGSIEANAELGQGSQRDSRPAPSSQGPSGRTLIYGAYGYTGELIARAAKQRGLAPVLGGRRPQPLGDLADELELESQAFQLESREIVERRLREVDAILLCAGPFSRTFRPVLEACLATGTHYLDITGEVDVFESIALRDEEARAAGVVLLPGVGFDVVPSDCLAVHLARRLPDAKRLELAIEALGGVSRGTALTMLEQIGRRGRVRSDGRLIEVPAAWKSRDLTLRGSEGTVRRKGVTIPWGDLATAWRSTGIPDIEVYAALSAPQRLALRNTRWLGPALARWPLRSLARWRVRSGKPGPTAAERARGRGRLWGRVENGRGGACESWLETPEGYAFTATTAVAALERVLAGSVAPGFQTPGLAFGPDFVLELEGVRRWDE
jgi:short subunit dehydrogenase-like uncharacterized protein